MAEHKGESEEQGDELSKLRREVMQLRKENAELSGSTRVLKEGSLLRYREQVLSSNWKPRLFELRIGGSDGATLRCFEPNRRSGGGEESRGQVRMAVAIKGSVEILREVSKSDRP